MQGYLKDFYIHTSCKLKGGGTIMPSFTGEDTEAHTQVKSPAHDNTAKWGAGHWASLLTLTLSGGGNVMVVWVGLVEEGSVLQV